MDKIDASIINKIFLEKITESLPQYIFWKDIDSIYLGCNKNYADLLGLASPANIVGKKDTDLNWQPTGHTAESFRQNPQQLMDNISTYPKDTRVFLDNNFESVGINGLTIAKELHTLGFTRLYLLSSETFEPGNIPDYIKVIRKDDIEHIKDW